MGVHACPTSAVNKSVRFICPSGTAYIGTFDDLSTAQIDPAGPYSPTNPGAAVTAYNVDDVIPGSTFRGFIRTDGTEVEDFIGAGLAEDNIDSVDLENDFGVMSVFAGGTSANFFTGNGDNLITLVAEGSILAWSDAETQSLS